MIHVETDGLVGKRFNAKGFKFKATKIVSASDSRVETALNNFGLIVHVCSEVVCRSTDQTRLHFYKVAVVPRGTVLDWRNYGDRNAFQRLLDVSVTSFFFCKNCVCKYCCPICKRRPIPRPAKDATASESESAKEAARNPCMAACLGLASTDGTTDCLCKGSCEEASAKTVELLPADVKISDTSGFTREGSHYHCRMCRIHSDKYSAAVALRKCAIDHCYKLSTALVKGIRLCKFHSSELLSNTQEDMRFHGYLKDTSAKLDNTKKKSKSRSRSPGLKVVQEEGPISNPRVDLLGPSKDGKSTPPPRSKSPGFKSTPPPLSAPDRLHPTTPTPELLKDLSRKYRHQLDEYLEGLVEGKTEMEALENVAEDAATQFDLGPIFLLIWPDCGRHLLTPLHPNLVLPAKNLSCGEPEWDDEVLDYTPDAAGCRAMLKSALTNDGKVKDPFRKLNAPRFDDASKSHCRSCDRTHLGIPHDRQQQPNRC